MNRQQLITEIRQKKSFLCVGLDPDLKKLPAHIEGTAAEKIISFNKKIIDATAAYCVAFKPNTAFYEALGLEGWRALEETCNYLQQKYPSHFVIADAKRGDIGNTSEMYAKAFFENLGAHAVTIAPYMGSDSIRPFQKYTDKWSVVLGLTSNEGAQDFEMLEVEGRPLFMHVIEKCKKWGNPQNMMFVVGATQTQQLFEIRKLIPDHFLLVPGVGAQGGDLQEVCAAGLNNDIGLLVNASRSILYAGTGSDFENKAAEEARKMSLQMAEILKKHNI